MAESPPDSFGQAGTLAPLMGLFRAGLGFVVVVAISCPGVLSSECDDQGKSLSTSRLA